MIYQAVAQEKLSMLGMGNMRLPTMGEKGPIDREKAREIIAYAYENGVNYFDTAFRYHNGESELFIGEALKEYPRDSFYLASKLPGHMMKYENGRLGFQGYLAGEEYHSISDIFEEQLKKCQVEYFDFYLLHNLCESSWEFYTNEELGVVDFLLKMKEQGKIRHLGFSSHGRADTIDQFLTIHEGKFEFVQIQLNYLDWTLQNAKEKYEAIVRHGLPVVVMEPVRGGRLIELPEKAKAILEGIDPGASMASWGFRYLQSLPGVKLVLSGMTTLEQLKENVEIFSKTSPWTEQEQRAVEQVVESLLDLVPCTGCRYCTEECPMHIDIPKLIAIYNEEKNGGAMLRFNLDPEKEGENPASCISCGACQRICPQNIQIPQVLKAFAEILKSPK